MKDLDAGERLGRKFTCVRFIPHGRGLTIPETVLEFVTGMCTYTIG